MTELQAPSIKLSSENVSTSSELETGVCDDRHLVEGTVLSLLARWADLLVGVLETCSSLSLLLAEGDWVFRKPDCFFDDFWPCVRAAIFDATKSVSETFLSEEAWKAWDDADTGGEILNLLPHDCIKLGDWAGPCGCGEASTEALDVCSAELLREHNPWCSLVSFSILSSSSSPESVWSSCFSPCSSPFNKHFMRSSCFFLDRRFLK